MPGRKKRPNGPTIRKLDADAELYAARVEGLRAQLIALRAELGAVEAQLADMLQTTTEIIDAVGDMRARKAAR